MRVSGAVVDDHGGNEGDQVEDNEDGNEPCVASSSARARSEEGSLEIEILK